MAMAATSARQPRSNRKVLIADDDPAVVRALSVRCKKLGLEVETAENGLQAILKASRNPPRLLILDINMPEADGFRVCEWLLDPQRPPVDVVMLTGRDDSDTLVRCDSFGAFYVPKNQETWDTIKSIMGEVLEIDEGALDAAAPPRAFGGEDTLVREKRNKVLIVEDDADLARALERRLKKCGAETMIASNGIDAYRIGDQGAARRDHRRLRDAGRRRPLSAVAAEEHRIDQAHPGHHDHRPDLRAGHGAFDRARRRSGGAAR